MLRRRPAPESVAFACAWFVTLTIPALALKLLYVRAITRGDLSLLAGGGAPMSAPTLLFRHLWPADVLSAALLATVVMICRALLGPRTSRLVATLALAVCLAATAIVALSLRQTGALPSTGTLRIAVDWLAGNPRLIFNAIRPRDLALLAGAGLWILVPNWLARNLERTLALRPAGALLPLALLVWVCFSIAVSLATAARNASSPVRQAIWLSVGRALRPEAVSPFTTSETARAAAYEAVAFPAGRATAPSPIANIPSTQRRPRHVVLISLETAPFKYYDLDRNELPAFTSLMQHAVIGDQHYSPAPMTSMSIFSMLTGTYPPASATEAVRVLYRRPSVVVHALPNSLKRLQFETAFIDTYDLTWNGPAEEQVLKALGFDTVIDARTSDSAEQGLVSGTFERRLAAEERSFAKAARIVLDAGRRGTHAFVVVATHLGHYDWPRPEGGRVAPPFTQNPFGHVLTALDGLMASFVTAVRSAGLLDEVIFVVTGDHGLRFRSEFEAAGEAAGTVDAMFHVPFFISAPALFPDAMHVRSTTSHVDLAPTLLELLGAPANGVSHDGAGMLDGRIADRITFMSSGSYPGLPPVDALRYRDSLYVRYDVVDRVTVTTDVDGVERPLSASPGALTVDDVRGRLREMNALTR